MEFMKNSADLCSLPEVDIFYKELVTGLQDQVSSSEISIYVWFR